VPIEDFPQTQPNLTLATETLYSMLTSRRIRLYDAPDLRSQVLNAASVETSRGIRLSKEKQSMKIDGAVALSFAVVAAGESGRPMSPEEFRALPPLTTNSGFDVRRMPGFDARRRGW
jgi:phage terminase large subunit-like protein